MAAIDITGLRFGRLVAITRVENNNRGAAMWRCLCDCSAMHVVSAHNLRSGHTKSCGCQSSRRTVPTGWFKHGLCGAKPSREYRSWAAMLRRCTNPRYETFAYYGARGIRVCDRWRYGEDGKSGFECFLADMGLRPAGMSLDRIEVHDDYRPGNCRWATASAQAQNRRYGPTRKLTATHVERIRAAAGHGTSSAEIAQRFGVTSRHVNNILAGRSWSDRLAASAP